jgi:hypothetical protein
VTLLVREEHAVSNEGLTYLVMFLKSGTVHTWPFRDYESCKQAAETVVMTWDAANYIKPVLACLSGGV